MKKLFCFQPKFFVPSFVLLMIIVGLSIGLPLVTKEKNGKEINDPTTTTKDPNNTTPPPSSTPDSSEASTAPTTPDPPPEAIYELCIYGQDIWKKKGLNLEGKFKQITPIKRVIVMMTKADACFDMV